MKYHSKQVILIIVRLSVNSAIATASVDPRKCDKIVIKKYHLMNILLYTLGTTFYLIEKSRL